MNDLLADFMQAEGPVPLPPTANGASSHQHQRASSSPVLSSTTKQRSWNSKSATPQSMPESAPSHKRTGSENSSLKENSTSFLARYRAARAARKSRGSKDLANESYAPLGQTRVIKEDQAVTSADVQQLIRDSTDAFLRDTSEVKGLLADIRVQQGQVESLHEKCKLLTNSADIKDGRARCQESVEQVTRTVKQVKDRLNALEELNAEVITQAEESGAVDSPEIQMRVSVMAGLTAKLQEACGSWGVMRAKWAYEERAEVGRQLYTVTGHQYSEDELQEVVDSGGQDMIYQQALMAPGSQRDIKAMLGQIEQRHSEMQALEQAMLDLYQVFLDMSVVVVEQGEMLDRIENWVMNTKEQMNLGLVQLIEAKKHRRAAQQKKAITFVSGVGLVGVGAAIAATGPGAVIGVPLALVGAGVAGVGAAM